MTVVSAALPRAAAPSPAGRDRGIDLVRAACVGIVVLLHALMVGVTVDASGPVFANAADGAAWFVPVTWVAQVMPLFFVIGGFAGIHAYRRSRERGGTAATFIGGRVQRLLVPAILVVSVVGIALLALLALGVPGEFVTVAGFRFGQPLWFLGVFLLCQAFLPALAAAHERAPLRALAALIGAAIVVDVLRAVTGIDGLGFLNLAFVWLALQQIGFFLADGRIDALPARIRGAAIAGTLAVLVGLFVGGVYSPDLYVNLNPPTIVLVLVGVVQVLALSLLRPRLDAFARRPRVAAVSDTVNARSMTIYLWHMPVLLALAGGAALLAMNGALTLPEPSSLGWWLGRPVWFALALALTAVVAGALGSRERRRMPSPSTSAARTVQAAVLAIAAVALLLVVGTSPLTAGIAIGLMFAALARAAAPRAQAMAS